MYCERKVQVVGPSWGSTKLKFFYLNKNINFSHIIEHKFFNLIFESVFVHNSDMKYESA